MVKSQSQILHFPCDCVLKIVKGRIFNKSTMDQTGLDEPGQYLQHVAFSLIKNIYSIFKRLLEKQITPRAWSIQNFDMSSQNIINKYINKIFF